MNSSTDQVDQLNAFGPAQEGTFDFTLLFEDSILTIAPAAIFLISACVRTAALHGSPVKVASTSSRRIKVVRDVSPGPTESNWRQFSRGLLTSPYVRTRLTPSISQAFLSAFVALELTILLLWAITPGVTTKASIPAACLDFVAAGVLLVLSSYEHTRSVAPSTLIGIYLLITIPFDIARVRTLGLLDGSSQTRSISTVLATSVVIKTAVLLSEAASKRHLLLARYRHLPPEATSGPYSKSIFWWINPLLRLGFSSILEIVDLYTVDDSLSSTTLSPKFQKAWTLDEKTHKHSLLKVTCSVLKWDLFTSAIPKLLLIGLKFAQPFLISRTINYVNDRDHQQANIGWGLVGAYAIVYTGLALVEAVYRHLLNRVVVRIRGGLVSLIYHKTVDLSITALEEGAALTLMSTDVERITESALNFHDAWSAFIEIAISMYLLFRALGIGCIAPGVCFLCAALATTFCTRFFPRFQTIWVEGIQSRVSFTSSMLSSMRSIKLLGVSAIVRNPTQRLRVRENVLARKFRWLLILRILFQNTTYVFAPVVTFAVYVIRANSAGMPLGTATAFSILSVLQLVDAPLSLLVSSLPALVASLGCFARIQTFLMAPSRQDHRLSFGSSTSPRQDELGNSIDQEGVPLGDMGHTSHVSTDDIVVLRDCSFGWDVEKTVLRDIDLRIKSRTLTMIIGPTGCGKSTLLKGILGETPSSSGFVYTATSSIAFGDQDPWTLNSTIKAGVCGESSYDETLYQEVLDCCGFREDLRSLPRGDLTVVGSKGISLSGGQKQRLALARAVFAQKDILILDDVFSGLDADTEEQIFRRLFSRSGILRRQGTTVLLVTHGVARLSYADWVVALTKDGAIAEQGTYENLRQSSGYVASLAVRFKQTKVETIDETVEVRRPTVEVVEADEDVSVNLLARKTGDWATYRHYFAASGWLSMCLAALLTVIFIASIKSPGLLVTYFTGPDTTPSSNKLFMIIAGMTASVSVITILLLVGQHFLVIIPRASNGLHQSLLDTVMTAPLSFFTKTDSGTTLNRFSQDLNVIDNELSGSMVGVMLQLALLLIGGGFMIATAAYFAATIPFVLIALFTIQKFYLRTSRQMRHLDLEAKAPMYSHFQETLSGLVSIRAFGWVEEFSAKNLELLDRSQRPFYLQTCIQRWLAVVLDLMVAALATILMVIIVSLRQKIDPGFVGLGLLNVMSFNTSLTELVKLWTLMETAIGAIARVRDFVTNTESEVKPMESMRPTPEWPVSGAVEIRNFSASYSESSELVLEDINLSIRPGENFGICGRSGSGKSSLLASLLHLLEFRDGFISIDGQDAAFVPRDVLRQRLNVIPQDPYWITTETVRFNLDPWLNEPQNDAALIEVLSKCQIWDVIDGKGGLSVKMDADILSHGQRQLFCLARSLLRKSKVVVLDEVSSSVDVHTDSIMQAIIREYFRDCTIISVAHRLNTIVDFDRIAVLHAGRVVECDTPETLLSRPESRFRELYEL